MHEVLVNRLEGLSLPRKSVVRLTDRSDMTLDVYRGRKTTKQQQQQLTPVINCSCGDSLVNFDRSCLPPFDKMAFAVIKERVARLLCESENNNLQHALYML